MMNKLKKMFQCQHKHTQAGFKQATRYAQPILIDFKECLDCGRVLRCKVSFVEVKCNKPTVALPPQHITLVTENKDVITGTLNATPIVELKMDFTGNPSQNRKEAEYPEVVTEIPKEPIKMEIPKPEPKQPEIREADHIEEVLEREQEDGPFSSKADVIPPPPKVIQPEETDEILDAEKPEEQKDDIMVEGSCFLKESHGSIARRRKELARRRARAEEALKKTGKATVKVPVKPKIEFLDSPDQPSKEDDYN